MNNAEKQDLKNILKDILRDEKKSDRWSIGNIASIISALGVVGLGLLGWSANSRINEINADLKTVELVGSLMDSLVQADLKKDVALIALHSSLVEKFDDPDHQNVNLIFNITEKVLSTQIKDFAEQPSFTEENKKAFKENTSTSFEVLKLYSEDEKYATHPNRSDYNARYKNLKDKLKELVRDNASATSSPANVYQLLNEQAKISISDSDKETIEKSEVTRQVLSNIEDRYVVLIHYDKQENLGEIRKFVNEKLKDEWSILGYELVQPKDNSARTSSVRFFYESDQKQAAKLQNSAKNFFRNKSNFNNKFDAYSLSSWAKRNSINVPEKQMELWIESNE